MFFLKTSLSNDIPTYYLFQIQSVLNLPGPPSKTSGKCACVVNRRRKQESQILLLNTVTLSCCVSAELICAVLIKISIPSIFPDVQKGTGDASGETILKTAR